ncbi:hypothetical protein FLONG3_8138 [Fusarium longipes]|uniref:Uncharacterized protein n=1 Tax=Fusarium longipes TaxID=694270 RepID=A0A395S8V3_9HYPO|nr:hypothetical protein FLONG3_8138 [Fusarium longipes]
MAESCATAGQPQAYRRYYSEPRPDTKLPPLNYSQEGHIHLVPGESYCRWRHPITAVICKNAASFGTIELRDHYRLDHGCKVASDDHPLFNGMNDTRYQQVMRENPCKDPEDLIELTLFPTGWYTDMLHGNMPPWPPATEQRDFHDSSSNKPQPKEETSMQASSEIQAQPRGHIEESPVSEVPADRQACSGGEEKQSFDLKFEDLPLGTQGESDRHSAVRLCTLFKQHQASMPSRVQSKLLQLLTSGHFQHNEKSILHPLKHQLSMDMYDEDTREVKWINVTYERWFILVGIYGWATLRERADGVRKAVLMRYGEPLDRDLTFKNSSDNSGSLVRPFLSQLGDEISTWGPMARRHEHTIQQHEQTILSQSANIQRLQAMNLAQQEQIDKLNAIVGIQSRIESHEDMIDNGNNVHRGREASQSLDRCNLDSSNSGASVQDSTPARKRVRHG